MTLTGNCPCNVQSAEFAPIVGGRDRDVDPAGDGRVRLETCPPCSSEETDAGFCLHIEGIASVLTHLERASRVQKRS